MVDPSTNADDVLPTKLSVQPKGDDVRPNESRKTLRFRKLLSVITVHIQRGGAGKAYTLLVNGLSSDSTYTGRIGRKVVIQDIIISMGMLAEASQTSSRFTVALVSDLTPSGTLPTANLIYDQYGLRELDNTPRFRVHMSKTFSFRSNKDGTGTEIVAPVARYIKKRIPLKFVQTFNGDDATLGSIAGRALYLIMWMEDSLNCDVEGRCRLRFSEE